MAFRVKERAGEAVREPRFVWGAQFAIGGLLLFTLSAFGQPQEFHYDVWHGHSRPPHIRKAGNMGALTITDSAISFAETYKGKPPKSPHKWSWSYQDIQQLKIAPKTLTVLTYKDNKWKLGADREYRFDLLSSKTFEDAGQFLKARLDQRLVAEIPDPVTGALWSLPVKHLLRFGGDEGTLEVGADKVVYRSTKAGESRTWRYQDIENISSSGMFQLTITTFERAKTHYGDAKGFNFALKQPLDEGRYNDFWLRLNQSKGLKILDTYRGSQ